MSSSRLMAALFLAAMAVSVAPGQWFEKSIWLPDSFPSVRHADFLYVSPVTGRVAVSNRSGTQFYDPVTRTKHGPVPVARYCERGVWCPAAGRYWLSSPDEDLVFGFDDRADTLVAVVPRVVSPHAMAYDAARGKLYVSAQTALEVFVLDPVTGAILDSVATPPYGRVFSLVHDSAHGRVYCAGRNWGGYPVVWIDCDGDTLAGTVPGTTGNLDIALDLARHRLYCLAGNPTLVRNVIRVIDTDSLVVLDSVVLPLATRWLDHGRLVVDSRSERLYALCVFGQGFDAEDTLAVYDLAGDSLVGVFGLPGYHNVECFAVSESTGKLYLGCTDALVVFGRGDSMTTPLQLSGRLHSIAWEPRADRIYVGAQDDWLRVVQSATDSLVDSVSYVRRDPGELFYLPARGRLYGFDRNGITIVGRADTMECWQPESLSSPYGPLAWMPGLNRLYLRARNGDLLVYDVGVDSVVARVALPLDRVYAGLALPEFHKLYLPGEEEDGRTVIYDCYADSVIAVRPAFGSDFLLNPRDGLVYGRHSALGYIVTDPRVDTVVARLPSSGVVDLAFNPVRNEVYGLTWSSPRAAVDVIDCATRAIVATVPLPAYAWLLVVVPDANRLYCVGNDFIAVVDCAGRQVVKTLAAGPVGDRSFVVNDRNHKLWLDGDGGPLVVDCRRDSVLVEFDSLRGYRVTWDPVGNRVFTLGDYRVLVFRDDLTGVEEGPSRDAAGPAAPTLVGRMLDLPGREPAELLDAAGRKVAGLLPGVNDLGRLAPGVYFVRRVRAGTTLKLVITR